jgi:hypothetical protein
MKKILLTLGLGFCFAFANAQTAVTPLAGYLSTQAAMDDISTTTESSVADPDGSHLATSAGACPGSGTAYPGIYWYTKTLTAGFQASNSRTSTAGKLTYTIDQPAENGTGNGYQPVGVGFGELCNSGTLNSYVLDLSTTSKVVSFDFTNTSAYDYVVQVQMQTSDGKVYAINNGQATGTNPGNDYLYTIQFNVAAGASNAFSQNFGNALLGAYGSNHTAPVAADFALIKAITITVVNASNTAAPNYWPYALAGATFTIDNFKIGDQTTIVAGINSATANIASSKLYPNPVSDRANVELNLNSASDVKVTLSDVMGKEVMVITEGTFSSLTKDFSVATLNKGIYTVNYFINGAAAKSELLMVK